jgi:hypothetical protein
MIELIVYARLYDQVAALVRSDSILVVSGRVRVRSDDSREVVADRLVPVDEAMASWTQEILLQLDLEAGGGRAVPALGNFLQRCVVTPAGDEDELRMVPLLVETRRRGKKWLLKSQSHKMPLTLDNLRMLRKLPGSSGFRIRCSLPAVPNLPRRSNGAWRKRAAT